MILVTMALMTVTLMLTVLLVLTIVMMVQVIVIDRQQINHGYSSEGEKRN
jgi:hypothetical protein